MTRTSALALAWSVAIFAACSVPGEALPRGPILAFDKVVHVVMFVGFAGLWLRALPERAWTILLAAIVFAVGIEAWQQLPLIGRSADPWDAVADVTGAVLGLGLEAGRAGWVRRREQRSAG